MEKLERTGPAEKERVASVPKRKWLASMPEPPLSKGKKKSRQSRVPDHEGEESQGRQEPHLGKKEGDERGSMRRKEWIPQ